MAKSPDTLGNLLGIMLLIYHIDSKNVVEDKEVLKENDGVKSKIYNLSSNVLQETKVYYDMIIIEFLPLPTESNTIRLDGFFLKKEGQIG